ncbi:MAG: ATP-binding protein [Gammaproteobacteria bacterium]
MTRLYLRIFLYFWLVILLTLAITVSVNRVSSRADVDRERAVTLRSSLDALAAQAQQALTAEGAAGLRRWLQTEVAERPEPRLLIVAPDNQELLGRDLPPGPPHMLDLMRRLDDGRKAPRRLPARVLREASGAHYLMFVPLPRGGGPKWLMQPDARRNFLLVLFLVSGGLCFLLARYLTRPIQALRLAGSRLAGGDLGARVGSAVGARRDEIGALAREFDRMAERVQELVGAQQRLLRDVSHELRSPLTRLHTAVGLIRQRTGDTTDPDLDRIQREAERLDTLIGQILSFSRLQALTMPDWQTVDLGGLVRDVVADASFEGQASGKHVHCDVELERSVLGDEALLRSAIENVVRNALEHARSDVAVTVSATSANALLVTVTDDGPGVPAELLGRVFEPFYQVPGGGAAGRGFGLGLAIAARAMELHQGSIRAILGASGGLSLELRVE